MRLLAISGSLRRTSYNRALLDAAAAECGPEIGFVFWNHLDSIPAYNEDVEIQPESVSLLKDEITRADAVLFATPEYNTSVPGSLKNALDWISRPFADNPLREKRAAVIGASQGAFGAAWAQARATQDPANARSIRRAARARRGPRTARLRRGRPPPRSGAEGRVDVHPRDATRAETR